MGHCSRWTEPEGSPIIYSKGNTPTVEFSHNHVVAYGNGVVPLWARALAQHKSLLMEHSRAGRPTAEVPSPDEIMEGLRREQNGLPSGTNRPEGSSTVD